MRFFKIALPLLNVILGVALFYWGDVQARKIIVAHGGALEEGLVDVAAEARYFHYALNAPAWALLRDRRQGRWSPSTYWRDYDLHYFLVVIVLWFSIGFAIDRRLSGGYFERAPRKTWWNRILAWVCILWGLVTGYSIMPSFSSILPVLKSVIRGGYGWWWLPMGLAWSLGLVAAGLYFMFGFKRKLSQI